MKGKTYIFVRPYFMADYILGALRTNPDYVIVPHLRRHGLRATLVRFVRSLLPGNRRGLWTDSIFPDSYLDTIRKVTPADKVILWSVENDKDVRMIAEEVASKKITSLLWNPMKQVIHNSKREAKTYPGLMRRLGVRVATFDRGDAEQYGFDYVGQVYRKPEGTDIHEGKGVFFIGADKGRAARLDHLAAIFEEAGIPYDFKILKGKHSTAQKYPRLSGGMIPQPLPYQEVMRLIAGSECVVELLQEGQQGVTLRALEALFFGKKLITDNPRIKEEDFFDPSRVLIIDPHTEPKAIINFIGTKVNEKISETIFNNHDIKQWINTLS